MVNFNDFFHSYRGLINTSFQSVDTKEVERAMQVLWSAASSGSLIFVGGNGGSCAIANHLTCDFVKGCHVEDCHDFRVISLSSNTPLLTALSNDIGYEQSLSYQLERLLTRSHGYEDFSDDVVILISSSGNSPNIVEAAKVASKRGCPLIGFTGFKGGELNQIADIKIHVPIENYGVVEDIHQSIMHLISQYIRVRRGC